MSIKLVVTGGYGNDTFDGSPSKAVTRGYTPAVVVTYPEGTLTTLGYGNPTTIADIVRRNYGVGAAVEPPTPEPDEGWDGTTVLGPAKIGPGGRWYTKKEISDILRELVAETEDVLDRKVAKRKRPDAIERAVIKASPVKATIDRAARLQEIWESGSAHLRVKHGIDNEAAAMAKRLAIYYARLARQRDEDDIAVLMAMGVL